MISIVIVNNVFCYILVFCHAFQYTHTHFKNTVVIPMSLAFCDICSVCISSTVENRSKMVWAIHIGTAAAALLGKS